MTEAKQTPLSFRHRIDRRYNQFGWLAVIIFLVTFGLRLMVHCPAYVEGMLGGLMILSLLFLYHIYHHRKQMLDALTQDQDEYRDVFSSYMVKHHLGWERHALMRLGVGTILVATMLALILSTGKSIGSQLMASVFIIYILGIMLRNWLDFSEKILLHDYERVFRDQASDRSDW